MPPTDLITAAIVQRKFMASIASRRLRQAPYSAALARNLHAEMRCGNAEIRWDMENGKLAYAAGKYSICICRDENSGKRHEEIFYLRIIHF